MLVIADSSPLIYLSRVGALHLLPTLFNEVVVPRAVWSEAVERRPPAPDIEALPQACLRHHGCGSSTIRRSRWTSGSIAERPQPSSFVSHRHTARLSRPFVNQWRVNWLPAADGRPDNVVQETAWSGAFVKRRHLF